MRPIACLLILMLSANAAIAREIYVDNLRGDDRRDGRSRVVTIEGAGPVRTIGRALDLVAPGDRVVVANTSVPYRESISLSTAAQCGSGSYPFVIQSDGAVLDGTILANPQGWEGYRGEVFRYSPRLKSHQKLFLDGRPLAMRRIDDPKTGWQSLGPLEASYHGGYLYFRPEHGKLPGDYRLACSSLKTGITLYHVHDVIISGLVVQGFQLDGVNAHDGVRECMLMGLTCRANGRSGIAVAGCSEVEISSCQLEQNGEAQLLTMDLSTVSVRESQLLSDAAPPIIHRGARLFVDGQRQPSADASQSPANGE